jgi:multiple sugar transport system permease protein
MTTPNSTSRATPARTRRQHPLDWLRSPTLREEAVTGLLFVLPAVIGLLLFVYLNYRGVTLSFTNWNWISRKAPEFVGLKNYAAILVPGSDFLNSLGRTLIYVLFVPVSVMISFLIALLANNTLRGQTLFRVVSYIPSVTGAGVLVVVWTYLFSVDGPVNGFLRGIGIEQPPRWNTLTEWKQVAILILLAWSSAPGMIVALAGLQAIPKDFYDAAKVDGASTWVTLTKLTIPLMSPTLFFQLVLGIIAAWQTFDIIYFWAQPGTGSQDVNLWTATVRIYQYAFAENRPGLGVASSVILGVVMLIFTSIQFIAQRRWVNYDLT